MYRPTGQLDFKTFFLSAFIVVVGAKIFNSCVPGLIHVRALLGQPLVHMVRIKSVCGGINNVQIWKISLHPPPLTEGMGHSWGKGVAVKPKYL